MVEPNLIYSLKDYVARRRVKTLYVSVDDSGSTSDGMLFVLIKDLLKFEGKNGREVYGIVWARGRDSGPPL